MWEGKRPYLMDPGGSVARPGLNHDPGLWKLESLGADYAASLGPRSGPHYYHTIHMLVPREPMENMALPFVASLLHPSQSKSPMQRTCTYLNKKSLSRTPEHQLSTSRPSFLETPEQAQPRAVGFPCASLNGRQSLLVPILRNQFSPFILAPCSFYSRSRATLLWQGRVYA